LIVRRHIRCALPLARPLRERPLYFTVIEEDTERWLVPRSSDQLGWHLNSFCEWQESALISTGVWACQVAQRVHVDLHHDGIAVEAVVGFWYQLRPP
jgi:hypothetical protein